jgi:hypothetical protein
VSTSALNITVLTWPPLWQYWPAYLAMARTEEELGCVRFQLRTDAGEGRPITDATLRAAFFESVSKAPTIALCEPRETMIPIERAGESARRVIVRRLPLMWRLPHWIIGKEPQLRLDGSAPQEESLWAYPRGTTSGDFVLGVVLPLLAPSSFTLRELPSDFQAERERVREHFGGNDIFATLTPWHLLGDIDVKLAHSASLPGPSREITAIQIPDIEDIYTTPKGSLVDSLGAQLRCVIDELTATQGYGKLISQFVEANWAQVNGYLLRQNLSPSWLKKELLTPMLAEYVRLGCYFPYKPMESAISAEIQKRMIDVFDELKTPARASIETSLTNFFGGTPLWDKITLSERLHVWKSTLHTIEDPAWNYIAHGPSTNRHRHTAAILNEIRVKVAPSSPAVSLLGLAGEAPEYCFRDHNSNLPRLRYDCFLRESQSGVAKPEEQLHPGYCAACLVGGLPMSVSRPAAVALSQDFRADVEYLLGGGNTSPCPLCYRDIEPLVSLFMAEARRDEEGRPNGSCSVWLFNGFDAAAEDGPEPIIFGIWWTGDTSAGQRSGNTGKKMELWRLGQRAGHVAWIGAWFRQIDGSVNEVSAVNLAKGGNIPSGEPRPAGKMFEEARTQFMSGPFTFGYVAAITPTSGGM